MSDKKTPEEKARMIEEAKKKLTPEQMQQLAMLQQMFKTRQGGGGMPPSMAGAAPKKPQGKFVKFLNATVKKMHGLIAPMDAFIKFANSKFEEKGGEAMNKAKGPILFGALIIFIFVIIGGIWSITAPIHSAAVAIGTVLPTSNKQYIHSQSQGISIVKEIFVKQGDEVTKGEKLIEFDELQAKANYEAALVRYRNSAAIHARLIAEREKKENIEFPEFLTKEQDNPEVAKLMKNQKILFESRNKLYEAERKKLKQEIARFKKEIEANEASKKAYKKNYEVLQEKVASTKQLFDKGFASKSNLAEFEGREAELKSRVAIAETEIIKAKQNITKAEIDLLNTDNRQLENIEKELQQVNNDLIQNRAQFLNYKDSLERAVLRAPVSGIVNKINKISGKGSVVGAGQEIMEITPTGENLVIEAKIPHKDIQSVNVGLDAKIRFSAYKSRTTPLFSGKVISLSPDTVEDIQRSNDPSKPPQPGQFYIARIQIDMEKFNRIKKERNLSPLHPGMQAEVQIITGKRTLLHYLLAPIADVAFRGFNEK